jgi:diguanylate cyclase
MGHTQSVVDIDGTEDALLLSPHARILEDRSGKLDLRTVQANTADWRPGRADALVFGFSRSTWWVHFRIRNAAQRRLFSTLDLGNPRQDYVTWHVVRNGVTTFSSNESGDRVPLSSRPLPLRALITPLVTKPHETVDVYVRLRSEDGLFESMPLRISSTSEFVQSSESEELLFTLYAGGLIFLGLYNLLLFFATREKVFGIYVAYLSMIALWSFTFPGYGFQMLWPERPTLNHNILTISSAWGVATFGWFAAVYLKLRERVPSWLYRLHLGLIGYNALVFIPGVLGGFALGAALGNIGAFAMSAVTMPTAIYLALRGAREAKFFVIAFALICTGVFMYVLQMIGVVPTNWFTTWSLQIGSALEALLLALGLADSLNVLKVEKFAAERRALEAQQALNLRLEQEVSERTRALELANRRLHELTITDELTGAFNRRHFNTICAATIANRKPDEALAFCMFDIDHFKAYNDRYGHQAGDAALRAVSHAVQNELRRSGDILFRLGGEEFGVAFDAASPQAAIEFAERLRTSIRHLALPHLGSAAGIVTASFGIGWWSSAVVHSLTSEQIYAVADDALYAAKEQGRDRVDIATASATGVHPALRLPPRVKSA